jgi:hypothetical protein
MQDCTSKRLDATEMRFTRNVVQPTADCYSIKLLLLQRVLAVSHCYGVATISRSLDVLNFSAKPYATQQIKLLRVLCTKGPQDQAVKVNEFSAHMYAVADVLCVISYLASKCSNLIEIGVRSTQHPTLDR